MREILEICTKVYWSSGGPEAFRVGEGMDGNAAEIYKATCKSSMIPLTWKRLCSYLLVFRTHFQLSFFIII